MKNQQSEDQKNYIRIEMTTDEAITWFARSLFVGLFICALFSGFAATVADWLIK